VVFEKNNFDNIFEHRVVDMLYIYFSFNIERDLWLNEDEAKMYAVMIIQHIAGKNLSAYGAIRDLDLEILDNPDYRYIYLDGIKKKEWVAKGKKKMDFPSAILDIVRGMQSGEEVKFILSA
jgi:hypothetical protein